MARSPLVIPATASRPATRWRGQSGPSTTPPLPTPNINLGSPYDVTIFLALFEDI